MRAAVAIVLLTTVAAGCSRGTARRGSGTTSPSPPLATGTVVVNGGAGEPTAREGRLRTSDGLERRYWSYVPRSAGAKSPLLLVLHGGGGTAEGARLTTFTAAAAERHGYIVVYPEGVTGGVMGKRAATWNGGYCCGKAAKDGVNDVSFLLALIDELAQKHRVDRSRIYLTGISNGGVMANRLACEHPERVAGISVVGSPGYPTCSNPKPVAVQIIHGTADPCAIFAGGDKCGGCWERALQKATRIPLPSRSFPCTGAEAQAAFWRQVNGCSDRSSIGYSRGAARCVLHQDCKSGKAVELCTITGGGHTWPGGVPGCDPSKRGCRAYAEAVGPISKDLDANDAMARFFAQATR